MFNSSTVVDYLLFGEEIENLKLVVYNTNNEAESKLLKKFIHSIMDIGDTMEHGDMSNEKAMSKISRTIKTTIYKLIDIHREEVCALVKEAGFNVIDITDLDKDIDYIGDVIGTGRNIVRTQPTITLKYVDEDGEEVEEIIAAGYTILS